MFSFLYFDIVVFLFVVDPLFSRISLRSYNRFSTGKILFPYISTPISNLSFDFPKFSLQRFSIRFTMKRPTQINMVFL